MSRFRVWTALPLLLISTAFPLAAQSGSIRGQVSVSAGERLANDTIIVEGAGLRATSNNLGR